METETTMPTWAADLVARLTARGYQVRESGPFNPATGRGWYSYPCEYQQGHVRVRVNTRGVIILRDPGCSIQLARPAPGTGGMQEEWSPNACRVDWPGYGLTVDRLMEIIVSYESRPAYTLDEAVQQFCHD